MQHIKDYHFNLEFFSRLAEKCQLSEAQRRMMAGMVANEIGWGGISAVSDALSLRRQSVRRGQKEATGQLQSPMVRGRERAEGGGRPKLVDKDPAIEVDLQAIVDAQTYGNPEHVLKYTNLSLRKIARQLRAIGYKLSHSSVGTILKGLGYSKQQNRKLLQVGKSHPQRNEQFEFIFAKMKAWLEKGWAVLSVDCKKKENLGNFSNKGAELCRKGDPRSTLDHDFLDMSKGTVAPYGVYVLNDKTGFVTLGISSDTAEFAVESIAQWFMCHASEDINCDKLYIICDGGGSNGYRVRYWKWCLAALADELGIEIHVSHLPPGTSKWNRIEHCMFCYISLNWAGKPLTDLETVKKLIESTETLKINCSLDLNQYQTGIKVSNEQMASIDIETIGEGDLAKWNYIIRGYKKL